MCFFRFLAQGCLPGRFLAPSVVSSAVHTRTKSSNKRCGMPVCMGKTCQQANLQPPSLLTVPTSKLATSFTSIVPASKLATSFTSYRADKQTCNLLHFYRANKQTCNLLYFLPCQQANLQPLSLLTVPTSKLATSFTLLCQQANLQPCALLPLTG